MTKLLSARLKLSRAREHLFVLNAEDQQFWLGRPGDFEIEYDEASGQHVVTWARFSPPASRLGLVVGDFAHNARAALDHAVFELSRGPQRPNPERTAFPLVTAKGGFRRDDRQAIRFLSPTAQSVVRNHQPLATPDPANSPLERLHRLSNVDKHKTLQPALGYVSSVDVRFRGTRDDPGIVKVVSVGTHGDLHRAAEGQQFLRVSFDPPYSGPLEMDSRSTVFLAYGEELVSGRDLHAMMQAVEQVLADLEETIVDDWP